MKLANYRFIIFAKFDFAGNKLHVAQKNLHMTKKSINGEHLPT